MAYNPWLSPKAVMLLELGSDTKPAQITQAQRKTANNRTSTLRRGGTSCGTFGSSNDV